jgi:hypothetical protein
VEPVFQKLSSSAVGSFERGKTLVQNPQARQLNHCGGGPYLNRTAAQIRQTTSTLTLQVGHWSSSRFEKPVAELLLIQAVDDPPCYFLPHFFPTLSKRESRYSSKQEKSI